MTNLELLIRLLIEFAPTSGQGNNYQHTHYRVHYDSDTHTCFFEAVCVNEYGSCYSCGVRGKAKLPDYTPAPKWSDNWTDLEA